MAKHNVSIGLAAVAPRFESLSTKAPEIVQGEFIELPVIALALVYAAGRAPSSTVPSKGDIAVRLREITEPRELGVSFLRIASRLEDPPAQ